jgi:hypothetical protein
MSNFPLIRTAIPRRRYRVGEYQANLLADIESGDDKDYQFILAFIEDGGSKPVLYVCAERNPPGERSDGLYRLTIINDVMSDVLSAGNQWRSEDRFAEEGLEIGVKALGLQEEMVSRLV